MWQWIVASLRHGFYREKKLYVTNTFAMVIILFLLGYREGAVRQMYTSTTVFSGHVVVRILEEATDLPPQEVIRRLSGIPGVFQVSQKIRTRGEYYLPLLQARGNVEVIGMALENDHIAKRYLSLKEGRFPRKGREALVPSSFLQTGKVRIGDVIKLTGKTSDDLYTMTSCKIVGIYETSKLSLFQIPRVILPLEEMENFVQPGEKDREYGLFLKDYQRFETHTDIAEYVYGEVEKALGTTAFAVDIPLVSILNPSDISVQFNFFFQILLVMLFLVVLSLVMVVNFNILMVLSWEKRPLLGAMDALGVGRWKLVGLVYLQSLVQLGICFLVALGIVGGLSWLLSGKSMGGVYEVLSVLLAGTNRVDIVLRLSHIGLGLVMMAGVVTVAHIPVLWRLFTLSSCEMMKRFS
ncbi:MAG: hypothetical protein HPY78_02965 [Brevinematales bacterium]|nr:hypothetical protein [Brevinematales bacterium]